MEFTKFIDTHQRLVLQDARNTYGDTAQILVSVEELCELAAVCSKYPRYEAQKEAREALHDKVIDEVADTLIVLDHIINIFGLTPVEIGDRVAQKIARLAHWLRTSSKISLTTTDREIPADIPEQFTIPQVSDKEHNNEAE